MLLMVLGSSSVRGARISACAEVGFKGPASQGTSEGAQLGWGSQVKGTQGRASAQA